MFEIFGYQFFQNALVAGILASIVCGVIGSFVVVKKMVTVSGGISHAAFGGIGIGYFLGLDPLLGATVFTLGVAGIVGGLRQWASQNIDTIIGAVWAAGMAVGILFVYLTPGFAPDLFGYLFGNILLVPPGQIVLMFMLDAAIVLVVAFFYHDLVAVTFDEEYARVMNLPVGWLVLLLLVLIALTVVMLIQVVGIILVIALLTLPAAISREFSSTLLRMMIFAIVLGGCFTTAGILLSYILDVPSGATIILVSTAAYAVVAGRRVIRPSLVRAC
ncbi:MAG TPA: metal ABC transporter permease [Methanoregulaceae archaeon]|nr:MAG: metal ABC transporter permease [Methanolinea sp.]HON80864.1 metal ABC transporter permease [Methanoregulaceae archaeon]HPD09600.1 metal ABC transporter permease [Methanoregulaceae archaeon]HRT15270.1 metal ABC transporter permease [Methanoregulaceae archaeon]HRU30841.1 metal ABC transporter permease [Methanoregulaceae archaeon]